MSDTQWTFTDQFNDKKTVKWTTYCPPDHKNIKKNEGDMNTSPVQSKQSSIQTSSSYSSTLNENLRIPTFFTTEDSPSSIHYHNKAALISSTVGSISRCKNPQKEY